MAESRKDRTAIWQEEGCEPWHKWLDGYPDVIEAQANQKLTNLDTWYRTELPSIISSRQEPYILLEELQGVASWKMTRGTWRERNRQLISGNDPDEVKATSRKALSEVPDLRKPISTLSTLAGAGPATASAVLAAYAPDTYPFFDDLVAVQIPDLGPVAFTAKYYVAYAEALKEKATQLNAICTHRNWTPHDVAQAMWAASGGKAAV
jgi:hypothetical protein